MTYRQEAVKLPLLYKGDRIAFSREFLESALKMAKDHTEGRTVFVELLAVDLRPDGSKLVTVKRD